MKHQSQQVKPWCSCYQLCTDTANPCLCCPQRLAQQLETYIIALSQIRSMTELDEAFAQLGRLRTVAKLGHALLFYMAKVTHNHLLHQKNYASFDDWAADHGYKDTHGRYMARVARYLLRSLHV